MITRRQFAGLGLGLTTLSAAGGLAVLSYRRTLRQARANIERVNSTIVPSRFGSLEYAEMGEGPPFLMIHGTGGGFDQGLYFAKRLAASGYRIIAPSRFGYLRSAMPPDPSPQNQADALVDLLDVLGIDKAAIAGGSAGALSALEFAIRHPWRCAALIPIVPATYAPNRPPARPWSPLQNLIAQNVLQSDFLFWTAITIIPDVIIETLLATDSGLVSAAPPSEQERVLNILHGILPVSDRAEGLLNDARQAGNPPPAMLTKITAPTLAISLEDDRFLTVDAARHIAAQVAGARLIVYRQGGHVWVGHDKEIFDSVTGFLADIGFA